MKTIYKYPLEGANNQIDMYEYGTILCAQMQHGKPCIWAEVDTDGPKAVRLIEVFGTGQPIHSLEVRRKYIGTVQENDGALVWHIYERLNP